MALNTEELIELLIHILFYFTIGSFGGFTKDLYETIMGQITKIRLGVIMISGTVSAAFSLLAIEYFDVTLNTMVVMAFVIGVLGFEIFGNMGTLKEFKSTVESIVRFKDGFLRFLDFMDENESKSGSEDKNKKDDKKKNK